VGTRFYLTNAVAAYTPPTVRGTWSDTAVTGVRKMLPRKTGANALIARTETSTSSSWSVLLLRLETDPVSNPATLDGAFTGCLGVLESDPLANMVTQLEIHVIAGDTDTVRGTLLSTAAGGAEWPAATPGAANGSGVLTGASLTPVAVLPGDRVIVEIGYRAVNTVATSFAGGLYYGGTSGDLSDGNPGVTTRPGWLEFAGAGWASAFGTQLRSGQSTTALTLGHASPTHTRRASGQSTTALALTHTQPLHARKAQSTTELTLTHDSVDVAHLAAGQSETVLGLEHNTWGEHLSLGPNESVTALTLTHKSYAQIGGEVQKSPPEVDLLPHPELREPAPTVRFIAQDVRTRRFLDLDVPLIDPVITYALSGATVIRGNLPDGYALRELGIDGWATWIHADEGGQLAATGMLLPGAITDGRFDVTAVGFTAYPNGIPYWGESSLVLADPADVIRLIWQHLQSYPDAQLGVTVDTLTKTPVTVGLPQRQDVDEFGQPAYDETEVAAEALADGTTPTADDRIVSTTTNPDTKVITIVYADGSKLIRRPRIAEETPYVLAWWTDTDSGQEISNLCQTGGIEYLEQVAWNADQSDTTRHLQLGYPRIGRRRPDLRCALDENLVDAFPLEEPPEQYAGEVQTRGMGEGRAAIRGLAGGPHPTRVRRVVTVTDQTIQKPEAAQANSQAEVARRLPATTIGELHLVADHPNMPRGSYSCGDEVLVTGEVEFEGDVQLWHRIETYDWLPDINRVVVHGRRAEQFAYGRFPTPAPLPPPNIIDDGSGDDTGNPTSPTAPRIARTPGELLRIGADNKQNHFKWQVGLTGGSNLTEWSQAQIGGGVSHDPEFKLVTIAGRQWVQSRVRMDAPTTSGSSNPRSEGREMAQNGTTQASWAADGGFISATLAIPEIGPVKGVTSALQIHDEDSDVFQLLRRKNRLMYRLNGQDNDSYVLMNNYTGGAFHAKLQVDSSTSATITINGASKKLAIRPKGRMYYKVGVYPQSSNDEPGNAYSTVLIGDDLAHWHPGWPKPITTSQSGGGVITGTVVSCVNNSDSRLFGQMAKLQTKYGFFIGDLDYGDDGKTGQGDYERMMGRKFTAPYMSQWIKTVLWFDYTPSDHDYARAPNGTATSARTTGFGGAYRKIMAVLNKTAASLLPGSVNDGIRHTWVDGRVRFIVCDERSNKAPNGSNGTVLGGAQETWLAGLLKNPGKGIKLVVLVGDTPMIGPETGGDDGWKGYPAARSRFAAAANACPVKVVRFSGDMHCVRVSKNRYGLDLELGCAPAHNETKVKAKGAEIDWSFPANGDQEGTVMEQGGVFVITDDGTAMNFSFGYLNSDGLLKAVANLKVA
jgi:hypothetical protein